eukprot:s942_g2.t1
MPVLAALLTSSAAGPLSEANRRRLAEALEQYSYFGEIVAFEPDGPGPTEIPSWGEAAALFRFSNPISLASVIWRPYYYATCEVSLPAHREWQVLPPAPGEVPSEFEAVPWSGERLCTQCASLSGAFTSKRAYVFNHPLELHLEHRQVELPAPADPVPPRLVMQVLRLDGWERHFLEGYAFVDLPRQPGVTEIRARLWAPLGGRAEQLSAKFGGAFLPLASPHLVATSDSYERDLLPRNRSALKTTSSTGAVVVRLQVIRRRRAAGAPLRLPRRGRSESPGRERREGTEGLRRRGRSAARLRQAAEPSPQRGPTT